MRKIREILRLRLACGRSYEDIAKSTNVSMSTVSKYVSQAKEAHLSWPLPADFIDEELEKIFHPKSEKIKKNEEEPVDWDHIHKELKRKNVTLYLLWNEYKQQNPDGLSYSQFCCNYRVWKKHLDVWMHQTHKAGEKIFVDYVGQTILVLSNSETGEMREAQIFVGVLGASKYTYVEATWTQTLPDWINSHINMFEFFGGCSEILVSDNLRSGVTKSHLYEPDINPTYQDMAAHYSSVIIPARSRKPKDKSLAEGGVYFVETFILAKLRNQNLSLGDLNRAIRILLEELNKKPFQKLKGSRLSHFEELDKPVLNPLPAVRYEYAEWKKVRVGFNYHVEIEGHHYSAPFTYAKQEVYARYNSQTVEIFHKNKRIASHMRNYRKEGYTTDATHMCQ